MVHFTKKQLAELHTRANKIFAESEKKGLRFCLSISMYGPRKDLHAFDSVSISFDTIGENPVYFGYRCISNASEVDNTEWGKQYDFENYRGWWGLLHALDDAEKSAREYTGIENKEGE